MNNKKIVLSIVAEFVITIVSIIKWVLKIIIDVAIRKSTQTYSRFHKIISSFKTHLYNSFHKYHVATLFKWIYRHKTRQRLRRSDSLVFLFAFIVSFSAFSALVDISVASGFIISCLLVFSGFLAVFLCQEVSRKTMGDFSFLPLGEVYSFMAKTRKRLPSAKAKMVLLEFLRLSGEWGYGYDIINKTGYKSGYVYPLLARLKEKGYLISQREILKDSDDVRPARTMYKLTESGKEFAWDIMKSNVSEAEDKTKTRTGSFPMGRKSPQLQV